jgi:hypothetical protein
MGVMSVYNIIEICRFHKIMAKYDTWPTCKGGQIPKFCVCLYICCTVPVTEIIRSW